jgi:hypothetical protein
LDITLKNADLILVLYKRNKRPNLTYTSKPKNLQKILFFLILNLFIIKIKSPKYPIHVLYFIDKFFFIKLSRKIKILVLAYKPNSVIFFSYIKSGLYIINRHKRDYIRGKDPGAKFNKLFRYIKVGRRAY